MSAVVSRLVRTYCFLLFTGGQKCGRLFCDHDCHPTPSGGKCFCREGYMIDSADNRTCVGRFTAVLC